MPASILTIPADVGKLLEYELDKEGNAIDALIDTEHPDILVVKPKDEMQGRGAVGKPRERPRSSWGTPPDGFCLIDQSD